MGNRPLKLIIADRETLIARRIKEFLATKGIETEVVANAKQLRTSIEAQTPDFILIDLLWPDIPANMLMTELKTNPKNNNIKVLVASGHNSPKNVKQAFQAGASDYIVKPFKVEDILARIVFLLQKNTPEPELHADETVSAPGGLQYLHLVELILKEAVAVRNPREKLFNLMQMLSLSMKAVRCSIIRTDMTNFEGTVIASSDDIRVKKINIDLTKYPEVTHTVNTSKTTTIENLEFNPELARLKKVVKTISFNSMIVTPITVNGEVFGVVSARMDSKAQKFSDLQVRFCQIISDVCSTIITSTDFFPYLEAKKTETDDAA